MSSIENPTYTLNQNYESIYNLSLDKQAYS